MTRRDSPVGLLARLAGDRMHSVEFALNDDVQFRFDGAADAEGAVTLTSVVWPIVEVDGRS
ncbi:hypothetical protein [Microbacterium sp. T2.11-28]|uniref:hypothetical protein n=1 Tax=Microbacterium sp. T2.11-28 TaxID=3041169 RepID=UPI00247788EE|nr:hypothetical protein [Microbacterium sp. T2.11-28]CAI9386732.1 hypothetical protein MICABA_00560 [Microbacterium sp. T2.11-28]